MHLIFYKMGCKAECQQTFKMSYECVRHGFNRLAHSVPFVCAKEIPQGPEALFFS